MRSSTYIVTPLFEKQRKADITSWLLIIIIIRLGFQIAALGIMARILHLSDSG